MWQSNSSGWSRKADDTHLTASSGSANFGAMSGSHPIATAARVGSKQKPGARSSSGFDFDHLVERTVALGAKTVDERAAKAGISVRTYYRLQRGEVGGLTILRINAMAEALETTSLRLQGVTS